MKKCLMMGLLVLLGVGCKGKGDESVTSSNLGDILGAYSSCEQMKVNSQVFSVKSLLFISEGTLSETYTLHSGSGCNSSYQIESISSQFELSQSGSQYNATLVAVTSTILSSAYTSTYNSYAYCGFTNWTTNVPKNISGADCDGVELSVGDSALIKVARSGAKLSITSNAGKSSYTTIDGLNFSSGANLTNGNYFMYNGSMGLFVTINSGSYSATSYDSATSRNYTENGTYTVNGRNIVFSATSYSNSCTGAVLASTDAIGFSQTSASLALKDINNDFVLLEKASFTKSQFDSAHLRSSFSAGCF